MCKIARCCIEDIDNVIDSIRISSIPMIEHKLICSWQIELACFLDSNIDLFLDLVVSSGGSFKINHSLWSVLLQVHMEVSELHLKIHFQFVRKSHGVGKVNGIFLKT